MLDELFKGLILGLSLAAPPGPVNALIAFRSLTGKIRGVLVGLGALSADLLFLTLMIIIKTAIPPYVFKILGVGGAFLLLYLSIRIFKSGDDSLATLSLRRKKESASYLKDYGTGLILGLSNPLQITWWLTVGLALVASLGYSVAFGFILGIIIWVFAFSYVINMGKASGVFMRGVKYFSSGTLLIFSIYIFLKFAL